MTNFELLDASNTQKLDQEFTPQVTDYLLTLISKNISIRNAKFKKKGFEKEPYFFLVLTLNGVWFNLELAQNVSDAHEWYILGYYIGTAETFNPEFGCAAVVCGKEADKIEDYFLEERFNERFNFELDSEMYLKCKQNDAFNENLNKN